MCRSRFVPHPPPSLCRFPLKERDLIAARSTGRFARENTQPSTSVTDGFQWTKLSTASVRERNPSRVALTSPGTSRQWLARDKTSEEAPKAFAT
jgi:hypothetical protein